MRIWLLLLLACAPPLGAQTPPVVHVEMTEFAFRPSTIRFTANRPVRFVLTNRGQLAHQFDAPVLRRTAATVYDDAMRIEAAGLEIVRLQPGRTAMVELTLRSRGRFSFACTIEGHKEAGMVGILDVR